MEDEEKNKRTATVEEPPEIDKASLLVLTLQFCDMVLITAPAFAEGSQGARVVALAHDVRPRLVRMLAAFSRKTQKPASAPDVNPVKPTDSKKTSKNGE